MKLKEFAESINELAEIYPDIEVIYSNNKKGDLFEPVYYSPALGVFKDGDFRRNKPLSPPEFDISAICIN